MTCKSNTWVRLGYESVFCVTSYNKVKKINKKESREIHKFHALLNEFSKRSIPSEYPANILLSKSSLIDFETGVAIIFYEIQIQWKQG